MVEPGYLLSNSEPQTVTRFSGLEAAFDPVTIGHLERLGIGPGQRCLEVGAGGGSIARWLATRVTPAGRVLAIDLDPQLLRHEGHPHLEVRPHDLLHEPFPEGPWDLIHERLVLVHLPSRLDVLDRMISALAPGGWLLVEDFDTGEDRTVDRQGPWQPLITKVARAFRELLAERGAASDFAASALRHLVERGLTDTGASGHVAIGTGGSPFAGVLTANTLQVRDGLLAAGITAAECDDYLAALEDSTVVVGSPVLISAWGRRA